MEPIRVSAVQMESALGDLEGNGRQIVEWMERARTNGARLIAFPEACLTGYSSAQAAKIAIAADDPTLLEIQAAARDLDIAVACGFIEKNPIGRPFITHIVFDGSARAATPSLAYRKTHLGRSERDAFAQGDDLPIGRAVNTIIGAQLCWESHIPDISTTLRAKGAELLLFPFASPLGGERRRSTWERFLPARAYDNGAYAIAVNALSRDSEGKPRGGGIAVFAPDGTVIESSYGTDPAMVMCDLDGRLPRCTQGSGMRGASYFDSRRPELYRA